MHPRLKNLFESIESQRQSLLLSLREFPREKLNRQPKGKWSINQIIAHLISAERLSVQYLNKKILGVNEADDTGFAEEVKMLLLIASQRLPFKFKAPKIVVDQTSTETDFNKLMEEWDQTRAALRHTLDQIEERQLKRKIYRHVRMGMMNIQHALKFFREHVIHHTPQIKQLRLGAMLFVLSLPLPHLAWGLNADTVEQKSDTVSTVREKRNWKYYFGHLPMKEVRKSTKFDLQIDTRNSFVKDFPINVYGVNLGLIRRERFRYGAGYYWINQNFNNKLLGIYTKGTLAGRVITTARGIPIPVAALQKLVAAGKLSPSNYVAAAQQINLWFASFGFMYTFYVSRLIEFAIPIEIGYGTFQEKLYDTSGNDFSTLASSLKPGITQGYFIPGQIGFDVLVKPHPWLFFEGTIGYRQTLAQNYTSKFRATSFDSQFNGEYYNLGVKIQLGTILSDWKQWKKIRVAKKGVLTIK